MKNKILAFLITGCLVFSGTLVSFADNPDISIFNKKYYSNYSTATSVGSTVFDPDVKIDVTLKDVDWLGISGNRTSTITFKSGASEIDLNKKLPNLKKFALRQNMAQGSLVGNTFTCSNIGCSWDGTSGKWVTEYNDPKAKIRRALHTLTSESGYLKCEEDEDSYDLDLYISWYDNKIVFTKGAICQIGNDVITTTGTCTIDDFYDTNDHSHTAYYDQSFAYCMSQGIKKSIAYSSSDEKKIYFLIPAGSYISIAHTKITVTKDLPIEISTENIPSSGALKVFYDAVAASTANTKDKWSEENECDIDAVLNGAFGALNDVIGALSEADTSIVIGEGEDADVEDETFDSKTVNAEINVTAGCKHVNTIVKDELAPTLISYGYSGDKYCANCGILLSEGELVSKLPSSIKLNYTSLKLKVGQSTSAVKVSFKKGDGIKSITSSNKNIVKASKSGSNGVKLTAGTKTGTAKVTVKLAGGKSAVITVKVQKSEVACTGLSVTSGISVKLKKGKTHQIKVTRKPVTCVQKITYKTSNKKVATVTSKGKVKAIKKGTAKITIKCGKKTKTVKITVK